MIARFIFITLSLLAASLLASPISSTFSALEVNQLPEEDMVVETGDASNQYVMTSPEVIRATIEKASKLIYRNNMIDGFPASPDKPNGAAKKDKSKRLNGSPAIYPIKVNSDQTTSVWEGGREAGPLLIKFKYSTNSIFPRARFISLEYRQGGNLYTAQLKSQVPSFAGAEVAEA